MNAEILCVGTEILLGDIVNTNAKFLSEELADLGINVYYQTSVGDNEKRLEDCIKNAFSRVDIVIATGGLGPTEDDMTKEIAAKFFSKKLVNDAEAFERLENYFKKTNKTMAENNKKQALVPEGCIVLQNNHGTAPGIIIEENGKTLVLLPGPPREMKNLFNEKVKEYFMRKQENTLVSRVLRIAGIGESNAEILIKDIIENQTNPTIAPYAKSNEVILRITAKAKTEVEANNLITPVANEIYNRLGDAVYGENETTLQEVVAKLIIEKNMTLSISESCTGGLLTSKFVEYPGISKVLYDGIVSYSNMSKTKLLGVKEDTIEKYGAVSHETAYEMAKGISENSGTNIGLSVTGIAGPDGGTEDKPVGLVYVGMAINGEVKTKQFNFAGDRQTIRERAVYATLNWARRELLSKN